MPYLNPTFIEVPYTKFQIGYLMPSTIFTTIPNSMEFAFKVARRIEGIEDIVSDEEALAKIDPAMLELILQIIQQILGCMENSRSRTYNRIKNHLGLPRNAINRIAEQMRMNTIINVWFAALGVPREAGDVVAIREAMSFVAQSLDENKVGQMQTELMWMTI